MDFNGYQLLKRQEKKHPYLFSQFQAIHCRSAIPIQDCPGNKVSYTAELKVLKPLVALMSAISTGEKEEGNYRIFSFEQKVPISPYLFAFVAGHLESRDIGPRSRVWSEPEVVEAGAYEFAETESYLKAAEELNIPYEWGRYDLLLLPPSFPYGGMENPCLTFVTPTLLAGDRSLSNVVAHEIAHSWFGNLITNYNWEHFWLNEGFTVFFERKIIGKIFGEQERQFQCYSGYLELTETVKEYYHEKADHPFTILIPKLDGIDPDDSFSLIPYEKGSALLLYLEHLVGNNQEFENFLRKWVETNRFGTVTSTQFKDFFLDFFKEKANVAEIDWDSWFFKPGMPVVDVSQWFDETLAQEAENLAKKMEGRTSLRIHFD